MAKKNADAIIHALGMNQTFMQDIVREIKNLGGTSEQIVDRLSTPGTQLSRDFAKLFMNGAGMTPKQGLRVIVDYGKSLAEMIAAGNYDWKNNDINAKHFKVEGEGQQEIWIELIHFGRVMTSDQVITELDKQGLRPAKIEELLALGAQHPDEQRKYWIAALGSVSPGRYVACLYLDGSGRYPSLDYFDSDWDGCYRFTAVRK